MSTAKAATADQLLHNMAIEAIGFAWQLLDPYRDAYAKLIEADRQLDNFVHITDPTLWLRARTGASGRNVAAQVKLVRAALTFLAAVDEIKATLPAGADAA